MTDPYTEQEKAMAALTAENGLLRAEVERHMREKVALAGLVAKERDEVERLRAFARWVQDHSNDPGVVLKAAAILAPKP